MRRSSGRATRASGSASPTSSSRASRATCYAGSTSRASRGIGATLNDVGWVSAFARPEPWLPGTRESIVLHGDELEAMYAEAWGEPLEGLAWFKALALYKFGIITGFNLMLHRRGKRHDPHW